MIALQAATSTVQPARPPVPVVDRKICRTEQTTGSIMPGKRICKLKSEWMAIDTANGRGVDTFRNRPQNGLSGNGGSVN